MLELESQIAKNVSQDKVCNKYAVRFKALTKRVLNFRAVKSYLDRMYKLYDKLKNCENG